MPAKNLTATDDMWLHAQELANANTEGDVSALITRLVALLYFEPARFRLRAGDTVKATDHYVPKTTSGHMRKNVSLTDETWERFQQMANSNCRGNKSRLLQYVIPWAYRSPTVFDLLSPSPVPLPAPQLPTVAQELRHHD